MDRRTFLKSAAVLSGAVALGAAEANEGFAAPPAERAPAYLADLSVCEPASALSRKPRRHRWRLLDYECDLLTGTMLVAGQNTQAPEIALPLNVSGWHAVWIGVRAVYGPTRLEARLTSDSTFTMITHQERREDRNRIVELFWKSADLTGQKLVLRQFTLQIDPEHPESVANPSDAAWVAYVKLVPLSAEEVSTLEAERKDTRHLPWGRSLDQEVNHRRLFAHNDAWSYTYTFRPTTDADIRRELEPFRDTDFGRIYWEAGAGDRLYFPTEMGVSPRDEWIDDPYRVGDRLAAESWRAFAEKGIDPLRVAADYAHEIGLQFHAAYRPAGFHFPVPEDEWNTGGLYDQHPEWRGRDRQGRATPRLSYAYPEVREYVAKLLIGIVDRYPIIDGVCLLFNRRPPLLDYEPPLVEGFQEKFGEDPRKLDERDPRWLAYRATFLTQLMREIRKRLDVISRVPGPTVSAIVMSSEAENLYFGLDVETWVKEGLVDTLIPYTSVERLDSSRDSWLDPADAEFFLRLTKDTRCELALNLMPRQLSPEEYRTRAQRLYQAGVEHLFFWDTNARNDFSAAWTALRRLGHRDELAAWVAAGSPPLDRPGANLTRLGDWDLSYDTPG